MEREGERPGKVKLGMRRCNEGFRNAGEAKSTSRWCWLSLSLSLGFSAPSLETLNNRLLHPFTHIHPLSLSLSPSTNACRKTIFENLFKFSGGRQFALNFHAKLWLMFMQNPNQAFVVVVVVSRAPFQNTIQIEVRWRPPSKRKLPQLEVNSVRSLQATVSKHRLLF